MASRSMRVEDGYILFYDEEDRVQYQTTLANLMNVVSLYEQAAQDGDWIPVERESGLDSWQYARSTLKKILNNE